VTDYDNPSTPDPFEADRSAALLALVKTGDELDSLRFAALEWHVPGVIPEGFGLLTGPPKVGKSWAVLGMALAVSTGGVALGKVRLGEPRPVLYAALEDGDRRLQERSRRLIAGEPIPTLLHTVTEGVTPNSVLPLIRAWLGNHGHRRPLVVLDTLGKVMPSAQPGESAYQRDYRIGGVLKSVVREHPGTSLLVVHHIRKLVSADWIDSTSGTHGLAGAADYIVNLHRARNEDRGLLRVTGRDVIENEYAVSVAEGTWTLDGDDLAEAAHNANEIRATTGLSDRSSAIVAFVADYGAPVAPRDVEAALDLPDARRYLARLADAGRLLKVGRGLYTPLVPTVPMSQDSTHNDPSHGGGIWDNGTVGTASLGGRS